MLGTFRLSIGCALAGLALLLAASCSSEYDKYYEQGKQYKDEDRHEAAIAAFEKAAQANPKKAKPWYRIAQIHKGLGQHPQAIAALEKAIQAEPDYVDSYPKLVEVYRLNNQLDKAEETAKKALELKAVKRSADTVSEIEAQMAEIENARKNPPPPAPTSGTAAPPATTGAPPVESTAPIQGVGQRPTPPGAIVPPIQSSTDTAGKVEDVKDKTATK
jgi:tetratricopeptide (TPR) repeat protein